MPSTINADNGAISGSAGVKTTADSSGVLDLQTNGTTRLTIDTSGNLGVGVTPSAWQSTRKAIQVGSTGSFVSSAGNTLLGDNYYVDSSGTNRYLTTASATIYQQAGQHAWYTAPSGTAGNTITFTQAMTLSAAGGLSVGTTDDAGAGNIRVPLTKSYTCYTADYGMGTPSSAGLQIYTGSGDFISFSNKSGASFTERARITAGGFIKAKANNANYLDVGVGNYEFAGDTANAYILKISNGGNNSNRYGAAIQCGANNASGTNYALVFDDGDGTRQGEITFSGGTTTYGTSSDYRLKENIRPIENATARLAQLKPCKWEWKRNGLESEGFVAHELQEVVPIAVAGEKDEVDANGNPMYQSVGAANIVPLLTAALQEAMARIESLEAKVAALEAK